MGATFTTQSVPLQKESVRGEGEMAVSTLVVRFKASFAVLAFVPLAAVAPKEMETLAPEATAFALKIAVVICVPEVPTWTNTTWEPAVKPEMSWAAVAGATG